MARRVSLAALSHRLSQFRSQMEKRNLDAYIVPHNDAHQSEYIAACDERVGYLSGFDGSSGTCVVTKTDALLWTDGRYFNQALQQLGAEWKLMKDRLPETPQISDWLKTNVSPGIVGVDPFLMNLADYNNLHEKMPHSVRSVPGNLVDLIWEDRPAQPSSIIKAQPLEYAGQSVGDKLTQLREQMINEKAGVAVVCALDDIAWFLNMRAADIDYNPLFFSYLVVTMEACHLFVDESRLSPEAAAQLKEVGGVVNAYFAIGLSLSTLAKGQSVWVDPATVNIGIHEILRNQGSTLIEKTLPIALWKSCKNAAELQGARNAHIRDGAAKTRWLHWMETEVFGAEGKTEKHNEVTVATKLEQFRAEQPLFQGLSFPSISAFGPNAAVIHYHALEDGCAPANRDLLYLMDSGAQYSDGTTDVTRTMHFGTPSGYQRDCFTRVLKGVIAIASQVFPPGATGPAFDTLGRQFLWQVGLDFRHGIGHGVGSYLCVHEGPCGIGPPTLAAHRTLALKTPLKVGMILSDEPGYYEDGKFGIRIENLMAVVQSGVQNRLDPSQPMLTFETLTMIPIQKKMIKLEILSEAEIDWIDNYHAKIQSLLAPFMKSASELEWLELQTRPLSTSNATKKQRVS